MGCLQLWPLEREHLPLVQPLFTDTATPCWLGGSGWPGPMPGRPLGELRGVAETGRYRWLTWDRGTYDPRSAWEDGPGGRGVIGTIDAPRPGASAMSWTRRCAAVAIARPWLARC
jgi:hypothetical protein